MTDAEKSFVSGLRTASVIRVGEGEGAPMTIRAQVLELWDAVRVETWPTVSVADVKRAALAALDSGADPELYAVKVAGFAVVNDNGSLRDAGVENGSILSIGHRWRRPVR